MDKKLLYFHGSTLPPGSNSSELWKPTLERPFFVADNPDAAIDYAIENIVGAGKDPSIFILVARKPLNKIAFDLSSGGNVNSLSSKFPSLVEFIHLFRDTNILTSYNGRRPFYDIIDRISIILTSIMTLDDGNMSQTNQFLLSNPEAPYDLGVSEKERYLIGHLLDELGLAKISNNVVMLGNKTSSFMKKVKSREEGSSRDLRRLIKSKVFQEIYKQGFKVVMDDDTTAMRLDGNEYAVFDMDVFQSGFSNSLPLEGIKGAIQKIKELAADSNIV